MRLLGRTIASTSSLQNTMTIQYRSPSRLYVARVASLSHRSPAGGHVGPTLWFHVRWS